MARDHVSAVGKIVSKRSFWIAVVAVKYIATGGPAMPEVIPFGLCKSAVPDARSAIRAKLYSQPKWLELVRHASDDYVALALRYRASCREARLAECQLAAEVLATGRFRDGRLRPVDEPVVVQFWGLCAARFVLHANRSDCIDGGRDFESDCAGEALRALISYPSFVASNANDPGNASADLRTDTVLALTSGSHVWREWMVFCARPAGWIEPRDPGTNDRETLASFSDAERRTIMLYRAGGIADRGAVEPIVSRPKPTGSVSDDLLREDLWERRSWPQGVQSMSLEPKPICACDSCFGTDWDFVVLEWLQQSSPHEAEPEERPRSRRASIARRVQQKAASAQARRDRVRSVYREVGSNWRLGLARLAEVGFKVKSATWYADLKKIDLEEPGWRERDSNWNPNGTEEEFCEPRQLENKRGFSVRRLR